MKTNIHSVVAFAGIAVLFASCQTTGTSVKEKQNLQDTTSIDSQETTVIEEPTPSPFEQFLVDNADITLIVSSSPKSTTKKKTFSKPYSINVLHNNAPVPGYEVSISYPVSRDGDSITFATTTAVTDSNGAISFMPEIPTYSFDSEITFQPAVHTSDPQILKEVAAMSVKAPYKVSTDYIGKGGILCLVDSDASGSPSSSKLLKHLLNNGFYNVGNADFNRQIKTGNQQAVYEAAHKLVGNSVGFLIYGTISYENAIQKTADGYTCTLTGDIYCLEMKTGNQLYATKRSVTVTAQTQWQLIDTARDTLTKEIAQAVIYGM
ncbi:MAG: hypothetical protein K6E51_11275 [Treponema sp.]|nr:hypothetical protein [Treponema sp.]